MIQLAREVKSQNLQSFFYLHEYLSSDNFGQARKEVRTTMCKIPYSQWSDEQKTLANKVCASYDQAGILLGVGALDKRTRVFFLSSSWGQSVIDQYETLEPYLNDFQTPTMKGLEFFKHFTWLYNEACKYRKPEDACRYHKPNGTCKYRQRDESCRYHRVNGKCATHRIDRVRM